MIEKTLVMSFKNSFKKQVNIAIKDVKDKITAAEAMDIMDYILANDLFDSDGSSLIEKVGCELVTKDTTELEVLF